MDCILKKCLILISYLYFEQELIRIAFQHFVCLTLANYLLSHSIGSNVDRVQRLIEATIVKTLNGAVKVCALLSTALT